MQRKLACSRCGKGEFASIDDLETHIVAQHFCTIQKKSAFYKCLYPNCQLRFPTAETCFRHELDVHLNGSLASLTLKQLEQNGVQDRTAFFKRRHFVEERLAIHDCLNQSVNVVVSVFSVPAEPNSERLKASRSTQRKFSCSKCGQCDFSSLDNLEIHIVRQHFSDVDVCYKCLYPKFSYSNCPVQFYTEIACLKHELDVHLKGDSATMTLTQIERRHFVTLRLAIHNCLNESINVTFSGHPQLNRIGSPQASLGSSMVKDEPSISDSAVLTPKPKRSRKQNFADLDDEDIKSTQPQALSSPSVIKDEPSTQLQTSSSLVVKDEPSLIDELAADIPGPSNYDGDLSLNYSEDELRIFLPGRPKKSNLTAAEKEAIIQAKIENRPREVAKILTQGNDLAFVDFDDEPGLILPAESREGYRRKRKILTTSEKEAIVTAWNEGCTHEEIAEMFACGKQTVYIVLQRRRKNQRSERENVVEVESIFKSNKKILPETSSRPFIVKDEPVEEELTTSFPASSNHNDSLIPSNTESIAKNNKKIQPETSSRPFIVKDEPEEELTSSFLASSVKDESSLIDELTSDIPGPSNYVDDLTRSNSESIVKNNETIEPETSSKPSVVKDEPILIDELASTIPVTSNYSDNLTFESAGTSPEPKRPRMEISPVTSSKPSVVKEEPSLIVELAADIPVTLNRIDNVILGDTESIDKNNEPIERETLSSLPVVVVKDEPSLIDKLAETIPAPSNNPHSYMQQTNSGSVNSLRFPENLISSESVEHANLIVKEEPIPIDELSSATYVLPNHNNSITSNIERIKHVNSVVKEEPTPIDEVSAATSVLPNYNECAVPTLKPKRSGKQNFADLDDEDNKSTQPQALSSPSVIKGEPSLIDELTADIPGPSNYDGDLCLNYSEDELRIFLPGRPKKSTLTAAEKEAIIQAKFENKPRLVAKILTRGNDLPFVDFDDEPGLILPAESREGYRGRPKDHINLTTSEKESIVTFSPLNTESAPPPQKTKRSRKQNFADLYLEDNRSTQPQTSSIAETIPISLYHSDYLTIENTESASGPLHVKRSRIYRSEGNKIRRRPGGGRKKCLTFPQLQAIIRASEQGKKKSDIAKMFHTSKHTVYRVLDAYTNERTAKGKSAYKENAYRSEGSIDKNNETIEPDTSSEPSMIKEETSTVIRKPGSGGKKCLTTQQMQAIVKANEQGTKKSDIAKMFDTSIPTVYRVLDAYRSEEPTASLPKPKKSRKQNFFDLNDDDGKRTEPQAASRSFIVKEESCLVHEFDPDLPGPSNYRHSNEQRASSEDASSLRYSDNLSSERTEHENAMNTKRGRPLAICNGHLMTQEKKSADGLRQYWRCQMCHQGCPGRAVSRTGSCDLTSTVAHDFHGSGPAVIKKRKVKYITPNPTTPSVRRDIIKASSEGLSLEQIAKKFDITTHSASLILNRWKVTSNGYIEVFAGDVILVMRRFPLAILVFKLRVVPCRLSRSFSSLKSPVKYEQGQWMGDVREYFYYVDHEGQLFMDDSRMKNFTSCFKDKFFLDFFFRRLRLNNTERYRESFPYISPCGKELNFVRCDDRPIVFTELDDDESMFVCNYSNKKTKLEPSKLCWFRNGRLYHPSTFDNYGLVKSKIADRLFPRFKMDANGEPASFLWKDELYSLDQELIKYS
ncbi:homeodomain-like domain-containing protein [Ditylenchus destructor]|nr:homeodomain-like domain-containing protein [Ditylenchus destructor]